MSTDAIVVSAPRRPRRLGRAHFQLRFDVAFVRAAADAADPGAAPPAPPPLPGSLSKTRFWIPGSGSTPTGDHHLHRQGRARQGIKTALLQIAASSWMPIWTSSS